MEEKLRFVFEYERDEQTMTELCQSFGIARETGYVWLRRYRQASVAGLAELNRAAEECPPHFWSYWPSGTGAGGLRWESFASE
jgi:transposase-like protein